VRVGITIDCAVAGGLGLARDNRLAWHLMEMIRQVPRVEHVSIVNVQGQGDCIALRDALESCDLIIATGGQIALPEVRRFRARGGRYVLFLQDNPYLDIVDQSIFDSGADFGPVDCHDAIWVHDSVRSQVPLLRGIYRCPVRCLPLVWSASLVDWHNRVHHDDGQTFAFRRAAGFAGPWRCVINAANTSARNMGVLPLIAVNRFHIENPGVISRVEFRNGAHFVNQLTFNHIAACLEIHLEERLTIWSDQDYRGLLALTGDFVFSHRLDSAVEFYHLDTLFAGYPLLHNAADLADLGYYYPDSDIDRAVALTGEMVLTHATDFDARLSETRRRLGRFAVDHPDNIDAYSKAILA